jgi:hypothetical protein
MSEEQSAIKIEELLITTGVTPDKVWITCAGGEGGEFSLPQFAEVVRKFYEENF